jgi:hypothetical protein
MRGMVFRSITPVVREARERTFFQEVNDVLKRTGISVLVLAIGLLLTGGVRRFLQQEIDQLVRELFQSIDAVQHALASSMLDAALLIGTAVLVLFVGMMLIRSFGAVRVTRDADPPPPPGVLKPH